MNRTRPWYTALRMVEYFRLLRGDWLNRLVNDWQRQDTLVLLAVVAVVIVVGWLIARR